MSKKTSERAVKKKIKKEIKQIESLSELPIEDRIKETTNYLEDIIFEQQREIELEKAIDRFSRNGFLKIKLVRLFCSGLYTQRQIARMLGISETTVGKWLRQEEVMEAIEKYQREEDVLMTASLKALRRKAIERASELIEGDNEMVSAIMIRDILDRTGHKPVDKKEIDINMTYEERLQQLIGVEVEYEVEEEEVTCDESQEISTEGEN